MRFPSEGEGEEHLLRPVAAVASSSREVEEETRPLQVISFADALALAPNAGKRHLLLGNGFSRDWRDSVFSYDALLEQASFGGLSLFARQAFDAIGTTDFEEVMRALRSAAALVEVYGGGTSKLSEMLIADAKGLQEVLVRTISARHPDRPDAISTDEYLHVRDFIGNFHRIYTLNYDLLLYWALMHDELPPDLKADDGFRTPEEGAQEYVTWEVENTDKQKLFYLHGALHVFDVGHEIQKYTWANTGVALIDQVRDALEKQKYPLFVSEGESNQKLDKSKHSDYLSRGYRSFCKIGGSLFVHGHSMTPNDEHIIRLIEKNKCTHLFVSLYGDPNSPANQRVRQRSRQISETRPPGRPLALSFYDACSAGVWRDAT